MVLFTCQPVRSHNDCKYSVAHGFVLFDLYISHDESVDFRFVQRGGSLYDVQRVCEYIVYHHLFQIYIYIYIGI